MVIYSKARITGIFCSTWQNQAYLVIYCETWHIKWYMVKPGLSGGMWWNQAFMMMHGDRLLLVSASVTDWLLYYHNLLYSFFTVKSNELYCTPIKPAMQAACRPLACATPSTGKIQPFSKMAIPFEPMMWFRYVSLSVPGPTQHIFCWIQKWI